MQRIVAAKAAELNGLYIAVVNDKLETPMA
jgi:hypothetical protein